MTAFDPKNSTAIGPARGVLPGWCGRRLFASAGLVLALSLAATLPTTGDIGLTWDEPAYRFSQLRSAEWWARLARARSADEVRPLLEPDALLYYWTYARHGVNFHPPLAGQLNLLTHALFGGFVKDIPARRLASVFEFALTITLGFTFLTRRYGPWVGGVMAGALLFLPRVYGDAHVAGTDTPGLLLWAATALAFWKGLNEPHARGWRVLVGVLLGLAFVEKMGAVFVLAPLLGWLALTRLPLARRRGDWVDGLLTSALQLAPLALALGEILRLAKRLPRPNKTDLFLDSPPSDLPGLIFAAPLAVWVARRLLGRLFRSSPVWGVERPGLETWSAVLAFAPVVGWLGNPSWWRETLPRFAHYYLLNTDRRGSLPDIQILYLGQTYEYSLPWHNAWVLIGVTVPAMTLIAAVAGLAYALRNLGRDPLPGYFLAHLVALPVFRMLPTPAHDGVRLFLPTFFFLAAFAGWGAVWAADGLGRLARAGQAWWPRGLVAAAVLVPAAWQLVKVHPFELSYYNEWVGGPAGAWKRAGFELTYWYDAFNPQTLAELNARLPAGATVDFLNDKSEPPTFTELQALGALRPDIVLGARSQREFPYVWLLTHDSKASAFTRLLFALTPWYERRPPQLDGLRVASVADPLAVSRAWALQMLCDGRDTLPPDRPAVPGWVARYAPWLGRLWGVGLTKVHRLALHEATFRWAETDPAGLRAAARTLIDRRGDPGDDPGARRLKAVLGRYPAQEQTLFRARPEALAEAVAILTAHPDAVRAVMTRYPYTDPAEVGGPLDRDLPGRAGETTP